MNPLVGPTRRILNSDLYRQMSDRGWSHFIPYGVADALCAIHGTTPPALGLQATVGADGERVVRTIPLLLAFGYGTRWTAFIEWTLRRWPGDGEIAARRRRPDETQAFRRDKPVEGDPDPL